MRRNNCRSTKEYQNISDHPPMVLLLESESESEGRSFAMMCQEGVLTSSGIKYYDSNLYIGRSMARALSTNARSLKRMVLSIRCLLVLYICCNNLCRCMDGNARLPQPLVN